MKKNTVTGFLLLAISLAGFTAFAQTPEQRAKIISRYDKAKAAELIHNYREKSRTEKAEALRLAEINNWPVTITKKDGTFMELMRVENGKPIYYMTYNAGSAVTIKANKVHTGGSAGLDLNGQGMNIGIWDGGAVRASHQDLTGRVTQKDDATTIDNHATHVAGTMMASGEGNSAAKGMAYEATLQANDWNSSEAEMAEQAAEDGLLISNHSYGRDAFSVGVSGFGAYNGSSYQWDEITHTFPYHQPVVAAGNDREDYEELNSAKGGRDLLFDQAVSKNVVVVGAIAEYNGVESMVMSTFSNWGPTDDARVKPDIVAKGVAVTSTWGESNTSYSTIQGTSMASPAIAGGLLLLQQHYSELHDDFMRSATLRGLMVHTADDGGTALGPDSKFGWGILDVEAGAEVITASSLPEEEAEAIVLESTLNNGSSYSVNLIANGEEPLTVTLSWTDLPGLPNSNSKDLVNDLDVRVVKGGVEYMPWRINPGFVAGAAQQDDNTVDNVEKIQLLDELNEVMIPQAGELYTITVTHKGNLVGGSQDYSLIISGIYGGTNSIDENKLNAGINMWPNPANDRVNFSFNEAIGDNIDVIIYDIQGRRVAQKSLGFGEAGYIDISNLNSGMYIVEFNNGTQKSTKKLIKE